MKVLSYGLVAVALLVVVTPALAFAESEDESAEAGGLQEGRETATTPQAEHGGGVGHSENSGYSTAVLFVTVAAVAVVVGYSGWKVYKAKRKATAKSLV